MLFRPIYITLEIYIKLKLLLASKEILKIWLEKKIKT
tara:strand:- start:164 stop:274 length:111 start_codon:yes stop_codon:yes gene_type:complete